MTDQGDVGFVKVEGIERTQYDGEFVTYVAPSGLGLVVGRRTWGVAPGWII